MLHTYCPQCEWYDEVFQECSSQRCDFMAIGEDQTFDFDILEDEQSLNDYIGDWFDKCDEDFGY